jgi:selenocysteine-specific elongation factor
MREDKKEDQVFRMSIDRVFSLKGIGTVVTGTSQGKDLKIGEFLQVYPGTKISKVRGIQNHGKDVESIGSGNRCAINLAGIEKNEVKRGCVVATPNTLVVTKLIDVEVKYLKRNTKILKNNQRVRLHHGTKEVICRVKLLDKNEIKPGENGLAQLILENEIVGFSGDLGILRSYSPVHTIGGITILNPSGTKTKRFDKDYISKLSTGKDNIKSKLENTIKEMSLEYPGFEEIKLKFGSSEDISLSLEELIGEKKVFVLESLSEKVYVHNEFLEEKGKEIHEYLTDFHKKNPLKIGENISVIRNRIFGKKLKNKNYLEILSKLEDDKIIKLNSNLISLYEFEIQLNKVQKKIKIDILEAFEKNGYKPPKYEELSKITSNSKELKIVFDMLVLLGELKFIEKDIFLLKEDYNKLMIIIKELGKSGKEITLPMVKEKINTSRKYLVAYLEYLDKVGITKRTENGRKLVL